MNKKKILLVNTLFAATMMLGGCKSTSTTKYFVNVEGGTGGGQFDKGSSCTITASVPEGKKFESWKSNDKVVSRENPYTFTVEEDITLTATFVNDDFSNYVKTVTKKTNEDFKVLNLTDIQLHDGEDKTIALDVIDQLVEKEKPNMITFLGDLLNDDRTYASINNAKAIIDKIDSYNIPWAPIFGNHDYEDYTTPYESKKTTTSEDLIKWYTASKNCLFTRGPNYVSRKSNYVVNVVDENTKKIQKSLIFMDSGLSGLDDTSVQFYTNAMEYNKSHNGGTVPSSALLTHIALIQYGTAFTVSENCEYRDIIGSINRNPDDLASGTKLLFPKIKEYNSTDIVICGHDHENAYRTTYDGITLAYSMKSSHGDKYDNFAEIGGSILRISNDTTKEKFYYAKADVENTIKKDGELVIKPDTLGYWKYSGAKLAFNISSDATTASMKVNMQGTNLQRSSVEKDVRLGAWNRLTANIDFKKENGSITADYGTLTKVQGKENTYSYIVDLDDLTVNTGAGEVACGDETLRIIYFNSCKNGDFKVSNIHFEFEDITETDQVDLSTAEVSAISEQPKRDTPSKPEPTVTIGGKALTKGTDFIYSYSNNDEIGTATLNIIPSGKGAHKYKGKKTVTFPIVKNKDDDVNPGHESAIVVNENGSYATTDKESKWVVAPDWYNCGKLLHIELKRLNFGLVSTGETVKFCLMGESTNTPVGGHPAAGNWNRFTSYYLLDFSDNKVVCYNADKSKTIATGSCIDETDNWWKIEIDFKNLDLNSGENIQGNDKETMRRVEFSQLSRSFKFDKVSLVEKSN